MLDQKFIGKQPLCFVFAVLLAWMLMSCYCSLVLTGKSTASTKNGLGMQAQSVMTEKKYDNAVFSSE